MEQIAYINDYIRGLSGKNEEDNQRFFDDNDVVIAELRKLWEVVLFPELNYNSVGRLNANGSEFYAILTHVPQDDVQRMISKMHVAPEMLEQIVYNRSLGYIAEIKERFPNSRLIAYTGAFVDSLSDKRLKESGIDGIVRKFGELPEQIEQLKKCLENSAQ